MRDVTASRHQAMTLILQRRLLASALLLAVVLTGCTYRSEAAWRMATVEIVALGDSNTDFATLGASHMWPYQLRQQLASAYPSTKYTLPNHGVGGRTTGLVLSNLGADCLSQMPDVVVLSVGTSDVLGGDNPTLAVPIAVSEANLRSIITQVLAATSANDASGHPLLIIAQPQLACSKAVFDAAQTSYPYYRARTSSENRSNNIMAMKELVSSLAREYGILCSAAWDNTAVLGYDGSHAGAVSQLSDGIHSTAAQQTDLAIWANAAVESRLHAAGTVN